ncbi:MAG TPA: TetR/AcrR family transcriptional regulator [Pseudonocardiaceae bacterium]
MARNPTLVQTRRRGEELEHALYAATLEQLTTVGYGRLPMDGVAARAHTGKAALYRRWPDKHALVLAALRHALPPLPQLRPDRSARDNLMAVFTTLRDVLGGRTTFPGIGIITEILHEPDLRDMFAKAIVAPRLQVIESILRHAEHTGELSPGTRTPLTAHIGPALVLEAFLMKGKPPTRHDLTVIVDTVLPGT